MDSLVHTIPAFVIPVVALVSVFTFVAVASWSENRRKEREAYYRSETLRKAMEQGGDSSEKVLAMMREDEQRQARKRVEGLRLGGLVTGAAGAGSMVFLYFLVPGAAVWLAGLVPLLIGIVLAVYGYSSSAAPSGE